MTSLSMSISISVLEALKEQIDKAKNLNTIIFMRKESELLSTKAEQLDWRRSKVVEMRAIGLSYAEIARELQLSRTSIASTQLNRPFRRGI